MKKPEPIPPPPVRPAKKTVAELREGVLNWIRVVEPILRADEAAVDLPVCGYHAATRPKLWLEVLETTARPLGLGEMALFPVFLVVLHRPLTKTITPYGWVTEDGALCAKPGEQLVGTVWFNANEDPRAKLGHVRLWGLEPWLARTPR